MKLTLVYFSPCGSTAHIADAVACGAGVPEAYGIDLAIPENRRIPYKTVYGEIVVFAFPVYHGRIPSVCAEYFSKISAARSPAAIVTNCGNEPSSPALSQLRELAEKSGFTVVAAAEFISRHVLSRELCAQRPDERDIAAALEFGKSLTSKLAQNGAPITLPPFVSPPSRYIPSVSISTSGSCTNCRSCAKRCPVGAINPLHCDEIDALRCISCMRCVEECPAHAKAPSDRTFENAAQLLLLKNNISREPFILV